MSDDYVGWYKFKNFNLRKIMDTDTAARENSERLRQKIIDFENQGKPIDSIIKTLMDWIDGLDTAHRYHLIWINALREGMLEIEQRLDKLEGKESKR